MRLSAKDSLEFDQCVDTGYSAGESIVLRYRNALNYGKTEREAAAYKTWL